MNEDRRKFLKTILVGGGVILAQKILGPVLHGLATNQPAKINPPKKTADSNFNNFKVVKAKGGLTIYDPAGEEIFQIDDGA